MDATTPDLPRSIPLVPDQRARLDRFREQLIASMSRLQQLARTLTRSPADAEDLLQATCLRALERGPELRDHANVGGWLARVMRNLLIDRARSPSRRAVALPANGELPADAPERIPLWRQVADEDLEQLLPTLSPQLRAVWTMHHHQGLDQNEIAARLRIPRATVATRVFRARAVLRDRLTAMYEGAPPAAPPPGAPATPASMRPAPTRRRPDRHGERRPTKHARRPHEPRRPRAVPGSSPVVDPGGARPAR
jgi:RNA polymerase sigma-70 factor, ECF subfamily